MKKVVLIGGSPMTGKSSIAMLLSSELNYAYMSTDDIGEAIQTVSHINPMQEMNYLDYYRINDVKKLIEDITQYHAILKNPINRLIDIHSSWGNPLIIEGWAIYPQNVCNYSKDDVVRVWLIADKSMLEERLKACEGFYKASDKALDNYLLRLLWHNELILSQCKMYNEFYVMVDKNTEKDVLAQKIINLL